MASSQPFAHLHVWSEYGLPDGACRVADLVRRAAEMDQPAVAVTDPSTLHSAIPFYRQAQRAGIKPILGCRLELRDPARVRPDGALLLLAEDLRGYRNLLALSTAAHLNPPPGEPPGITVEALRSCARGLIALTGGPNGVLREALRGGDIGAAARRAAELVEIFGRESVFLELQNQGQPEQRDFNERVRQTAARAGLPTVVTNEVRYLRPEDAPAQRLLRRIRTGSPPEPTAPAPTAGQHDLADGDEMARRFPDDEPARRRTVEIARRCTVEFGVRPAWLFPRFPLPPGFARWDEERDDAALRFLREQVWIGLERRLGIRPEGGAADPRVRRIRERADREIEVIGRSGMADYFLVVADMAQFARRQAIAVGPGRGAAGGSLVAYALGITDIEPLRFGLSFERFLNPERPGSAPDFDLEVCPQRRAEVIGYLRRRYGEDRVAQIVTFTTFAPRAALRDAARALDIPAAYADRWTRLLPDDPHLTLAETLRTNTPLRRLAQSEPTARRVLQLACAIEGLPRNTGTHPAGIVISSRPLVQDTPLQRDRDGARITQYDMNSLADVGLVKLDLLSLRALGVQQEAADRIEAGGRATPGFDTLPLDDAGALALLNRGDTVGIFQLENAGLRDVLRRLAVSEFRDLVAAITLHRPATMPLLEEFIARKHGKAGADIRPAALKSVLSETYGLYLYPEQVQQAAEILGRLKPEQADLFRAALPNPESGDFAALCDAFRSGCRRRRLAAADTENALDMLRRFADPGFSKAHAVALALLAFRAALLKAHHPREFFCAALSNEAGDFERTAALLAEAQRAGVTVLRPDLNRSQARFTIESGALRYGLAGIKFVGPDTARALVVERDARGPYRGLIELCARVPPEVLSRRALESLVRGGALDFTGLSRRRLFEGIAIAMDRAERRRKRISAGQSWLPGLAGAEDRINDDEALPDAESWPESVRLAAERELLGFHTRGHPLTRYEWLIALLRLDGAPPGEGFLRGAGLATALRAGSDHAEFRLEMMDRNLGVTVRGLPWEECRPWLREDAAVWVEGRVCTKADGLRAEVSRIGPLDSAPSHLARRIRLRVPPAQEAPEALERLRAALAAHPGPIPAEMNLLLPSGERVRLDIGREYRVSLTESLVRAVEEVLGRDALSVEINP